MKLLIILSGTNSPLSIIVLIFFPNTEFFLTVNKINAIDKQIGKNELEIEKIKDEYGLKDEDIESGYMSHDKEMSTDSSDENKEPMSE